MAGDQVYRAAIESFDISVARDRAVESVGFIENAMTRPSVLYRPSLSQDRNAWIALYGADLAIGVVGCGDSPAAAMDAFDKAWFTKGQS